MPTQWKFGKGLCSLCIQVVHDHENAASYFNRAFVMRKGYKPEKMMSEDHGPALNDSGALRMQISPEWLSAVSLL